jgi:glyoxylase-like metal-dependent hydrolase (beta-lactamase superfamily II)
VQGPVEIVPGVHGLGSEMVNWYLVEQDGRLCAVDAGLPRFWDSLESDLGGLGHGLDAVEALVLTHSDGDHTGIANQLREAGAQVLIHSGDEEALRKPRPKGGDASPIRLLAVMWRPGAIRLFRHFSKYGAGMKPAPVEPTGTFGDGDVLDVPGRPRVIPTPGHTRGHCAFHFERHRALFVGDALCTWHPVKGTTGPQLMPFTESNRQALESLSAIEDIDADVVLVGHGEPWRDRPAAAVAQARALARA